MNPCVRIRNRDFWALLLLAWAQISAFGFVQFQTALRPVSSSHRRPRFTSTLLDTRSRGRCYVQQDRIAQSLATDDSSYLENLLIEHGYSQRLVTLSASQLPVIAELYSHGQLELCQILSFQLPSRPDLPPLAKVSLIGNETEIRTIDIGQITTIWADGHENQTFKTAEVNEEWKEQTQALRDSFPVQHCDFTMQRLYNSRQGRAKSGLAKKQIAAIVDRTPEDLQSHIGDVLRKVVKAGPGMARLVDSSMAMDFLYEDYPTDTAEANRRRMVGAAVLTDDAALGGRFKRMGSIFVATRYSDNGDRKDVVLINGGWLAVDQSVRVGTEARKFAERSVDKQDGMSSKEAILQTAADERIAQRLECLAMGEVFSNGSKDAEQKDERDLELDVRAALSEMKLPPTPEGAQSALVRIGRWSEGSDKVKLEPWGREVLEAARTYADFDKDRRRNLYEQTRSPAGDTCDIEERLDLTKLPCVCIDARSTSFRDDAIGIRSRISTGRKVIEEASKWELLIHIADVSDIYSPNGQLTFDQNVAKLLKDAAAGRGESRYDLPLGPLHLMPPVALKALSLDHVGIEEWSTGPVSIGQNSSVNRCVTLWAYIDERNGKLLDKGIERTLVSVPLALDYGQATAILEGDLESKTLKKARALLAVAERNLLKWSNEHKIRSDTARKREERLSARELVAKEQLGSGARDDGRSGFQRTRGHRLVDAALNLYAFAVAGLLGREKAPVPFVSGSGAVSRGGRLGTAPLRRYIDGVAQRQALSVLCNFGGPALTKSECIEAGKIATRAKNKLNNIRSLRSDGRAVRSIDSRQRQALRLLQAQLAGRNRPVPAISSGRHNEVIISGVGAVARCGGIEGTIKPGQRLMVRVKKIDPEKGALSVELVQDGI